jgi:hypothetical protein
MDRGTATVAVALIGRVAGRWRLAGATAGPATVAPEALIERLRRRLTAADPALAGSLQLNAIGAGAELPRVSCTTGPPPEITVLGATGRAVGPLADAAELSGWRVQRAVLEGAPITAVTAALANPRATTVLAGSGDPPGADERPLMAELIAQVRAVAERRPDITLVLTGSLAAPGGRHEVTLPAARPGATIVAPLPGAGGGGPLGSLLDRLRAADDDGRRALGIATGTLAEVMRRPVELVEVGQACGMRAIADHAPGGSADVATAVVADAALLPRGFTDAHLDAIAGWLTVPIDRLRLRDRLRDLAVAPWGDAAGDGVELRLAAARAALQRLATATRRLDDVNAGLLVASGGVFGAGSAGAVALALADAVRRPGIRVLALDHARLLAPLGTIVDPDERRQVMTDLRDDLLVPLGSVVMPAGLRPGRSAGRLVLHAAAGPTEIDLEPGSITRLPLAPGELGTTELELRDALDVGVRARRVTAEVTGGLAGLMVDLRDIPLRLPDRVDRRRETLAGWQRAIVAGGA